ncbi:hypothetical protein [Parvibium lacunae]|uniref:Uncharacterized protein n=1 Tax=Parvibium lacunae TaxID=1888893 RepID=A0A368L7S0_9BURK|nr:hypothetical protein [Parvibium lacunae]RCS59602.1 hypothetical protein DU000_02480 [Parvibium lacunae]
MRHTLYLRGGLLPATWLDQLVTPAQSQSLAHALGLNRPKGTAHSIADTQTTRLWRTLLNRASHTLHDHCTRAHQPTSFFDDWLKQHFFSAATHSADLPYATLRLHQAKNLPPAVALQNPAAYQWFCCDPVHLQLTTSHVELGQTITTMSTEEADALARAIEPILLAANLFLWCPTPDQWLLASPLNADGSPNLNLRTCHPTLAKDNNIHDFLPRDYSPKIHQPANKHGTARQWRRILNEIEMTWHDHPVNQSRQAQQLPAINSVWLYGSSLIQEHELPHSPFLQIQSNDATVNQIRASLGPQTDHAIAVEQSLYLYNDCWQATQQNDDRQWIKAWHTNLINYIEPHLALLRQGVIDELELLIDQVDACQQLTLGRFQLHQFWRDWPFLLQPAAKLSDRLIQFLAADAESSDPA